jgi:phosphopantetheinyl transferase
VIALEGRALLPGEDGSAAGRALLAQMYTAHTGAPMPPVAVTERGKPYFPDGGLHFSISHTKNHAFCVLSRENIGMDAEEIGRRVSENFLVRYLSPAEQQRLGDDPQDGALRLWVLKEAEGKRTGKGIGDWMKNTDFDPCSEKIQEIDGCYVAVLEDSDVI